MFIRICTHTDSQVGIWLDGYTWIILQIFIDLLCLFHVPCSLHAASLAGAVVGYCGHFRAHFGCVGVRSSQLSSWKQNRSSISKHNMLLSFIRCDVRCLIHWSIFLIHLMEQKVFKGEKYEKKSGMEVEYRCMQLMDVAGSPFTSLFPSKSFLSSCCFLNFIPRAPHLWLLYFSPLPCSCYVSTRDGDAGFPPSAVWIKQFALAGAAATVPAGSETIPFAFMCLLLSDVFMIVKSPEISLHNHPQITSSNTHQVGVKVFVSRAKSVWNLLKRLSRCTIIIINRSVDVLVSELSSTTAETSAKRWTDTQVLIRRMRARGLNRNARGVAAFGWEAKLNLPFWTELLTADWLLCN